jgi:hypothetical protein
MKPNLALRKRSGRDAGEEEKLGHAQNQFVATNFV